MTQKKMKNQNSKRRKPSFTEGMGRKCKIMITGE